MDDDEVTTIRGTVLEVRGPNLDGSYTLDVEREETGETVTITVPAELYYQAESDASKDGVLN